MSGLVVERAPEATRYVRVRDVRVPTFVYGTAWGVPRGLLGLTGIPSAVATAALFAGVQGSAMTMMPALDIAPPPTEWDARELAVDAFHHVVYAVTVGLVFGFLDRRSAQARER